MTHSAADVLRHALVGLGVGTLPSVGGLWPISVDSELATPDNAMVLFNTAGVGHSRDMNSGQMNELKGFQLRLRSTSSPVGTTKAEAVRDLLLSKAQPNSTYGKQVAIGGNTYLITSVVKVGQVLTLGNEPTSKRTIFTINGQLNVEQLS